MNRKVFMTTAAVVSFLLLSLPAYGAGHTWRFSEIFSNPDGTIMFIELVECCGGPAEYLPSQIASAGNTYFFPSPISCGGCSTAGANLLVATQGFADLPGAPTPDFIIPDGPLLPFFNVAGDALTFSVYDTLLFGALPTNGVTSLLANGTPAVNSPTNLAGDTATVVARCKPGDFNFSGGVNVTDLLRMLAEWGSCPSPCDMDLDFNGTISVTDLLALLSQWGSCP